MCYGACSAIFEVCCEEWDKIGGIFHLVKLDVG